MSWTHDRAARRRDWLLYLLLFAAVLCLPQVIAATGWFPEAGRLVWPVLWAALLGVLLAHMGTGDLLAFAIALVLGLEYGAQFAGKILPSPLLLIGDLIRYVGWAWDAVVRHVVAPLPFSEALTYTGEQLRAMVSNISGWYALVRLGEPSKDLTAMTIGVAFGAWILAWNAGYQLFRRRHAFAALLPIGAAVVANVAFTDIGMSYVHVYLAIVLLALVRSNVSRMEAIWSRLGLDFSIELKRDATVTGSFLALAIVVVAMLTPYVTYGRAVWAFWDRYGQTFLNFYDRLDKAFAGRNPVPEPTPGGPGLGPHSVRSTGTLGEDVVLLVRTSDPPPPPPEEMDMLGPDVMDPEALVPKHYWRERTYDTYTGSGWDSSQRQEQPHAGGEPWGAIEYPHSVLTQTYELVAKDIPLAFGVNEPQYIAQPYRAVVRGEGDLAALLVGSSEYQVVSKIPAATQEDLQAAEGPYPAWVAERFLQLPEKLPKRIVDLATQIVQQANAQTRYDKARAIERYLRSFDYDLELEPPPLSEDVVDYFLFQAQRGYCDYSATAMTVMLRAIGIAARYASGYNMGHYDYRLNAWVVRQSNAHAWTEVYFPGYGWIEFEPTPTQRIFERASAYVPSGGSVTSLPPSPQRRVTLPPLWLGAGVLLFLVLFAVIWPPRWFRRRGREPRQMVLRTYERLVRRARWAGLAPVVGQTPSEYLAALAGEMERRAAFAAGVQQEIEIIGRIYHRARYSQQAVSPDESYRVETAWRRVRGKLTRLAFVGAPRGSAP